MDAKRGQAVITIAGLGALISALTLGAARPAEANAAPDAARSTAIRQGLLDLPLSFEPNLGQTDGQAKFLSRARGISLYLTPGASVLVLDGSGSDAAVRMDLVGGNPAPAMEGLGELPGKVNYLRGNDPAAWRTNVPTFGQVRVRDAWPGIDLVHHGNGRQLEHDFVVAPGAEPGLIRVAFSGAEPLRIDAAGDLLLATPAGDLVERAPVVYQEDGCERRSVAGRFVLFSDREVGFEVGAYDRTRTLVIDPVLVYSTYLGGSGQEDPSVHIAADGSGNAYLAATTYSADFPVTTGAYDMSQNGQSDLVVAKLSAQGDSLLYSTFIGGTLKEGAGAIAVDGAGNAFVAGLTTSSDFPVAVGAFQTSLRGTMDAFILKLDPTGGALVYSTYLGGSIPAESTEIDTAAGIAIDSGGNAYVAGRTNTTDFPTTPGAFDRSFNSPRGNGSADSDAFVTKLNPNGSALVYSTYLGGAPFDAFGSNAELASGIAVDAVGQAFVAGTTNSKMFPVTMSAYDRSYNLKGDAFVTKLNPAGSGLVYSTFLGGSNLDAGSSIAIDGPGSAHVGGYTYSANFPTTSGAFDRTFDGSMGCCGNLLTDGFVTKLNPTGTALVYSTYLGGNGADFASAVVLDSATGAAFVGGRTTSTSFPTTPDAFDPSQNGNYDAFLTQFSAAGGLVYSTYFGGTASDFPAGDAIALNANRIFLCGQTLSTDLPLAGNPLQPANAGGNDTFVAWFDF